MFRTKEEEEEEEQEIENENARDKLVETISMAGSPEQHAIVYSIMTRRGEPAFLETRRLSDYPRSMRDVIDLITFGKYVEPIGSQHYKIQEYPGDVDLLESVDHCCDLESASLSYTVKLQEIVRRLLSEHPEIYFSDFKAGYDRRFFIYIGEVVNADLVIGYNREIILRDLDNIRDQGLFSPEEYDQLASLVIDKSQLSVDDYYLLFIELRKFYILRWTPEEILSGFKMQPGNRKIFLDEAIASQSIVKLDVYAPIEGRYVEVSNWFILKQTDVFGNTIELSMGLNTYMRRVAADIVRFRTTFQLNTFKALKRLFNLLVIRKDYSVLERLVPIFSSPAALAYQLLADVKTLLEMLDKEESVPEPFFKAEIADFPLRMQSAPMLREELLPLIDEAIQQASAADTGRDEFEAILRDVLLPILSEFVEREAALYIQAIDLDPLSYVRNLPELAGPIFEQEIDTLGGL